MSRSNSRRSLRKTAATWAPSPGAAARPGTCAPAPSPVTPRGASRKTPDLAPPTSWSGTFNPSRLDLREPNATYNVGLILGGASAEPNADATGGTAAGKSNVIAAAAFARGDLRTLSNEQTERMTQRMREIVAAHLPGTQAEISFEESYPAMPPTAGNRALLGVLNDINADLGLEPMRELDPLNRGAGDISFVADKVDGLVGFGAVGHGSHAPGETVDLSSFDRQIKRTALMMTRLSRTPRN